MLSKVQVFFREFTQVPGYHLLLEAFLLAWIVWLLWRRSQKYAKSREMRLTREEEEQLLSEWHPEPLVPPYDHHHPALSPVVLSGKVRLLASSFRRGPSMTIHFSYTTTPTFTCKEFAGINMY